ncbi:uncharacterized protein LOC111089156 [Limulus polyphemus]|uniref:Uncharacterized protein LOC111089156 n=1 Tax=Limulus polyphemus TaxID=6850 RepID=A0ABM1TLP0_LIMPO|nr:uncharacterized protein LOC111089156 [Limulus polyphemus]
MSNSATASQQRSTEETEAMFTGVKLTVDGENETSINHGDEGEGSEQQSVNNTLSADQVHNSELPMNADRSVASRYSSSRPLTEEEIQSFFAFRRQIIHQRTASSTGVYKVLSAKFGSMKPKVINPPYQPFGTFSSSLVFGSFSPVV